MLTTKLQTSQVTVSSSNPHEVDSQSSFTVINLHELSTGMLDVLTCKHFWAVVSADLNLCNFIRNPEPTSPRLIRYLQFMCNVTIQAGSMIVYHYKLALTLMPLHHERNEYGLVHEQHFLFVLFLQNVPIRYCVIMMKVILQNFIVRTWSTKIDEHYILRENDDTKQLL